MKKASILLIIALLCHSCDNLLSEKSDLQLATPETLEENQALLDNYGNLNVDFTSIGEGSADDFYITDADFNALQYEEYKRMLMWMPDNINRPMTSGNNWLSCYRAIYICNSVLFNLEKYNIKNSQSDNVRGQALAMRAFRYLDAAQTWCLAYDSKTAESNLGLPLRLDPDMNTPSVRSNLKQTYNQIINDLREAITLLPNKQVSTMRISKTAALAILSRVYLYMGDYQNALDTGLAAFAIQNQLMDYNTIDPNKEYTILEFNTEVLLWASMKYEYHLVPAKIPKNLYNSYEDNDLRKEVYFMTNKANEIIFTGYYNNVNGPLVSVATDELYLNIAESYAQLNNHEKGLEFLNKLLVTRWKKGTYKNATANSKEEALAQIKTERRKELLLRGTRWPDIKRYNRDGANITLSKVINGQIYTLPPNDLRYALAIPDDIIKLSGIPQNPR